MSGAYTTTIQAIPSPSRALQFTLTISGYANALQAVTITPNNYSIVMQQLIVPNDYTLPVKFVWIQAGVDTWDATVASLVPGVIIQTGTAYLLVRLNT
jgi:hypothetical protein